MKGDDYPTRLRTLEICQHLAVLPEWLPNLSSLRKLKIWDCPKLSSLLEENGMDPSLAKSMGIHTENILISCPSLAEI
ncbi:hypothetical protein CFP56_020620 [Quercus suber]|uniref:CC-NBS-LRR protein n=1 Tax=Quercus suber TaxID=58331 RepID=A0AAW0KEU6_QUESU